MGVRVRPKRGLARTMFDLRLWIRDTIPGTGRRLRYGERSEHLAARHLKWRGYRIIARNFKAAGAEIDIIVKDRDTIVFVEVKARMSDEFGPPEIAVDDRKQYRIRRAAEIFANRYHSNGFADEPSMRFDIIAISGDGRGCKVEHLKDAF
jgi:putative endonuclease